MAPWRKRILALVAASLASALVAACSSSSAQQPASGTKQLQTITLGTTYLDNGYEAPYVAAQDLGYYKAEGLQVKLVAFSDLGTALEALAAGKVDFLDASVSPFITAVSTAQLPIEMVSSYIQGTVEGFTYKGGTQLTSMKDLVGKNVITTAAAADLPLLNGLLDQDHLSLQNIHTSSGATATRLPSFLKGGQDSVLFDSFVNGEYQTILTQDPTAKWVSFSQFGLDLYNHGLATRKSTIASDPTLVKEMVTASSKGWAYAQTHPQAAVADLDKAVQGLVASVELKQLDATLPYLHSPATDGHPLGWMAESDWTRMIQEFVADGIIKKAEPLSDYYTDSFISG